ncbi:TetR family transcriptional regulator [Luteitalea sp. TBR-22]|uniref:TetR/AcrR family transcriptional regulator n=1 Tax=Luteitalea sp. TBR-22 TaxID=2802971 RepID=UPI001AF25676|nr:TetR/AcrR family transcriptional regulator [Luteitalea sp. TBR-22]BCS31880.1 TetR family transcriptional regulator [Luteitalea sp. TBR-22]
MTRAPDDPSPPADTSVRERLLATASTLFYREGIRAVGIQRVIEEAGVAKASLYAHFASKDELVAAYLARRSEAVQAQFAAVLDGEGAPVDRLLGLFDTCLAWMASAEFRGCPFQHADSELGCAEHPARKVLAAHRAWLQARVAAVVREAGVRSPDQVAGALLALFEGAVARALAEGTPAAGHDARWAATVLLGRTGGPRTRVARAWPRSGPTTSS